METRLTWKDWAWTGVLLLCLLVLLPLGLWGYSKYRENKIKSDIRMIVPGAISDAEQALQRAGDLVAQEVTSTSRDRNRAPNSRLAVDQACRDLRASVTEKNDDLIVSDYDYCALFIKRGDAYIRVDGHGVYVTEYRYDFQDFADLLATDEPWRLYPNGRNWRVKYKLRTDPIIILDFEVRSKDADYGY